MTYSRDFKRRHRGPQTEPCRKCGTDDRYANGACRRCTIARVTQYNIRIQLIDALWDEYARTQAARRPIAKTLTTSAIRPPTREELMRGR